VYALSSSPSTAKRKKKRKKERKKFEEACPFDCSDQDGSFQLHIPFMAARFL
jgi:hypothetical protein